MSKRSDPNCYGSRGGPSLSMKMGMVQKTSLIQKKTLRIEKHFTESCLPKTKAIAFNSSEQLLPLLRSFPVEWSFIDKIVVLLAPKFRQDVEQYYATQGKCMEEMFKLSQIEYLDVLLSRDLSLKLNEVQNGGCSD